jgi:hypothetical protein
MANLPDRRFNPPALPPVRRAVDGNAVAPRAAAEQFTLSCVCAKFDRPYELRFERQASGRLRCVESVRLQGNARAGSARTAFQKISVDEFESYGPCAWCMNQAGIHQCGYCGGALVCGARLEGNVFHCRDSCGASWVGVPLTELEAAKEGPRKPMMSPPPRVSVPAVRETAPAVIGGRSLIIRR